MASKSRKMIVNRDRTVTSLTGHSIAFKKGEPTHVPPGMYHEILAIGGEFADGEGAAEEVQRENPEPADPIERDALILAVVCRIADKNDNDDFTGSGLPKTAAVTREAGFKVDGKDVARAWQKRADDAADAKS